MRMTAIRYMLLVLLALVVGTMFGIWVGFNPAALSAAAYVEHQQTAIRSLNVLLPTMGAACLVLTVALVVQSKADRRGRSLLAAAAVLLVVAAIVTRLANQPINALVKTWSPQAPPANWADLRDEWWRWHIIRTWAGVGALALTVAAVLRPRPISGGSAGTPVPSVGGVSSPIDR
jgi:uncharacterized membrane protein